MDATRNPFNPGAGTPPPELAGRDSVLKRGRAAVDRARAGRPSKNIVLLGLRGVGKTVLLNEFEAHAEATGCHASLIEADSAKALPDLLTPHLHRLLSRLDRIKRVEHNIQQAFQVLRSFAGAFKVRYGDLEVAVGAESTGDLAVDLTELLIAVAEAAKVRDSAAVILIDEVQCISASDLSALMMALHRISQRQLPLVMLGAGLPQLPKLASEAKSYAERLFEFPAVERLDTASAAQALVEPAKRAGVEFDGAALDVIVAETQGYPYYIQVWGAHAWDVAEASPITLADAEAATRLAIGSLDAGIFNTRLQRLTERQQDYARAMARLALPAQSSDVAATLGVAVKDAGALRDEVIRKGIGYAPRRGMIDFTIPLFDAYLRRQGELVAAAPRAAGALAAGSAMEMKSLTVRGRSPRSRADTRASPAHR